MASRSARPQRAGQRLAAVDAVAAYLADGAEVYHITERTVGEDPIAAGRGWRNGHGAGPDGSAGRPPWTISGR
jgi:hypothetical protein